MSTLGEICEKASVTEWSIKDFSSLPVEVDSSYECPEFSFANESWWLTICPNGQVLESSEGYIGLYLNRDRESSDSPITVEGTLEIKTTYGKLDFERHFRQSFDEIPGYGYPKWISRSELLERKSDLLPSDTLTLVCKMEHPDFNEHSTDGALCEDFKKMLLNGKNHDLTLKVGGKELRAHQDVLSARSPVFESMLNHDTTEKETGVVDIPDCDPQAMELFLSFVYSGKIDALDQTNMLALYYIADKYDMPSLKQNCCDFIKKSLSRTNICEVIQLALNHSDTSLLEYATEYFMDNTVDILLTVEWQNFMKDNATRANELLIKSFRKKDSKN